MVVEDMVVLVDLLVVKEEAEVLLPEILRQEHLGKEILVVMELVLVVMLVVAAAVLAQLVEMPLEQLLVLVV